MVKIYLLTAPFDEEAKTGDGQYAASLTSGFVQNYEAIQCTWLKRNMGHYAIPLPAESTSIPHETIPSAEVLQPVANKRTTISGYKLDTPFSPTVEVEEINKQTVSPKTPKVIVRHDDILHSLTIMDIYSQKPIQLNREKVSDILSTLDTKLRILTRATANNAHELSKFKKQNSKKNHLVKLYKLNIEGIQQYCSLNEYIEAHLEDAQFETRHRKAYTIFSNLFQHFENPINLKELEKLSDTLTGIKDYPFDLHSNNLPYDLENDTTFRTLYDLNLLKDSIDTIIFNLNSLSIRQSVAAAYPHGFSLFQDPNVEYADKVSWVNAVFLDGYRLTHDQVQFSNALLNPSLMGVDLAPSADVEKAIEIYTNISNKLQNTQNILLNKKERAQLISDLQTLILKKDEPFVTSNTGLNGFYSKRTFSAAEGFHLAYQANQRDPVKHHVISNIINSMQPIDDNTYLDIHIRPPDCGVFISPRDILTFQEAGIKVNITIHEYKQNYTRRYLQQYTHDLMRQANTVQFFNEMDRDNAIIAATYGDCDKRNTDEPSGVAKKAREVGDFELDKFPVEPYDLERKSGLTVASQQLSTAPSHPLDVISRKPNILSFGTIRPGKGFEEALSLARLIKADAETINNQINAIPIVKLAGDPQDKDLMQHIVEERFGASVVEDYQRTHQYNNYFNNSQRRDYWKGLVNELNNQVTQGTTVLNNPYIEIHPWCESHELLELKESCKYVCRMDDMGMRNNGSAIISVLDVGIVYTKFGSVTDDIYTKSGQYGAAVDIGEYRYGKYSLLKREEEYKAQHGPDAILPRWLRKNPDSDYKRKPESRDPKEILDSIIAREVNQLHTTRELSDNYKTVVEAQKLLRERFSLKNAADHLLENVGLGELIIRETPEDLFDEFDPVLAQTELLSHLADIRPSRFSLSLSAPNIGFFSSSCASESRVLPHKLSRSLSEEILDDSKQYIRAAQKGNV
ncbi:Dot/Icm T4SS effector Ceg32/SidI [Legionella quateirensis]|uniref:Uncharacterized protein n=1 Tax=Legionella quateirensis TaxID=45072 RepID=A0A378KTF9_9GAMM|nr:Dot/Icm T4SS effector Ceg32/SidI [Legionella quateirensis]KTD43245.1 hypothetical protein Lqua_3146 [Legionella quateirensis]STY18124.1 Uncharacterised protein [Legionella quateirensis]